PVTIFYHGVTQGASDSLDAMTLWVQTVRTPLQPRNQDPQAVANGRLVFAASCAQCHGGEKWTKSQVVYDNDPTFTKDPTAGGVPFQAGLVNAGTQIVSLTVNTHTLPFLNRVRTFDAGNPIELRGQGAAAGTLSLGGLGFNSPSLLGVGFTAPYFHDGSAVTLDDVFSRHRLDTFAGGTIGSALTAQQIEDLRAFLLTIDGTTESEKSETDTFLQSLGG
ncbi:MAG TPA: hypothetical protein VKE69_11550, partial [Planctomycetota bacterium]|nr:hypothetical protein [Planctomycetota bacterium]